MKCSSVILCVLLSFLPGLASAGPFGFEIGMSIAEIRRLVKVAGYDSSHAYLPTKTPIPLEDFEAFVIVATPEAGLCSIRAASKTIQSSAYGDEIRRQFEKVASALGEHYGPHKKHDFLKRGSIWKEPQDWTMGLVRKERFLAAYWNKKAESRLDGTNIQAILLDTVGIGQNRAFITVTYEFKNFESCRREREQGFFRGRTTWHLRLLRARAGRREASSVLP